MKKQIISLLTLMMAFASASYAEEDLSEQIAVANDTLEAVKDSVVEKVSESVPSVSDSDVASIEEQVDSVATDTTEPYVPYSEGLFLRPEVGGGIMMASSRIDTKSNFDVSAGVNVGYQLNASFSLGIGCSFYYASMNVENFDEVMSWNATLKDEYVDKCYRLPFYVMGRWKFMPRKLTPFVDGRFGYVVGLNEYSFQKDKTDPGIKTNNSGLFLEASAGVQYKRLSIALVINRFSCEDSDPEYRKMNGWDGIKTKYSDSYVGLKLGFDFNFNNNDDEEEAEETEESASAGSN